MPVDHYENFPVASWLLPPAYRHPIEVIYRFARSADDFADEGDLPPDERLRRLAAYTAALDRIEQGDAPSEPLFADVGAIIRAHALPIGLFRDLISAFSQDVTTTRYADFTMLLDYCRRSANPVGRLLLHVFGRATPVNLERSDRICTALQLTNFWQDIAIDWRKQRVYLPQDDLQRFAVDEAQIASGHWNSAWAALLDYQIDRTRRMMLEGAGLARELPGRIGWEIRLTVAGGLRILDRLQRIRGNVFRQRPVLGPIDWLTMVAKAAFLRHRPT